MFMSSSSANSDINKTPVPDAPPPSPTEVDEASKPPEAATDPTQAAALSGVKSILKHLLAGITVVGLFAASLALLLAGSMIASILFMIGSATVALLAMFFLNSGMPETTEQNRPV